MFLKNFLDLLSNLTKGLLSFPTEEEQPLTSDNRIITKGLGTLHLLITKGLGERILVKKPPRIKPGGLIKVLKPIIVTITIKGKKQFIIKNQYIITGIKSIDLINFFNIRGIKRIESEQHYNFFVSVLQTLFYDLSVSGIKKFPIRLVRNIEGIKEYNLEKLFNLIGTKQLDITLITDLLANKKINIKTTELLRGLKKIDIHKSELIKVEKDISSILVLLDLI